MHVLSFDQNEFPTNGVPIQVLAWVEAYILFLLKWICMQFLTYQSFPRAGGALIPEGDYN